MPIDSTLRSNPFHTYRDPKTGRWVTVFPATTSGPQVATIQRPDPPPPRQQAQAKGCS